MKLFGWVVRVEKTKKVEPNPRAKEAAVAAIQAASLKFLNLTLGSVIHTAVGDDITTVDDTQLAELIWQYIDHHGRK